MKDYNNTIKHQTQKINEFTKHHYNYQLTGVYKTVLTYFLKGLQLLDGFAEKLKFRPGYYDHIKELHTFLFIHILPENVKDLLYDIYMIELEDEIRECVRESEYDNAIENLWEDFEGDRKYEMREEILKDPDMRESLKMEIAEEEYKEKIRNQLWFCPYLRAEIKRDILNDEEDIKIIKAECWNDIDFCEGLKSELKQDESFREEIAWDLYKDEKFMDGVTETAKDKLREDDDFMEEVYTSVQEWLWMDFEDERREELISELRGDEEFLKIIKQDLREDEEYMELIKGDLTYDVEFVNSIEERLYDEVFERAHADGRESAWEDMDCLNESILKEYIHSFEEEDGYIESFLKRGRHHKTGDNNWTENYNKSVYSHHLFFYNLDKLLNENTLLTDNTRIYVLCIVRVLLRNMYLESASRHSTLCHSVESITMENIPESSKFTSLRGDSGEIDLKDFYNKARDDGVAIGEKVGYNDGYDAGVNAGIKAGYEEWEREYEEYVSTLEADELSRQLLNKSTITEEEFAEQPVEMKERGEGTI